MHFCTNLVRTLFRTIVARRGAHAGSSRRHPAAARAVTRLSPGLEYYSVVRLLAAHPFPLRLSAYRVRYPGATREHDEPSWGHVQIFRTVPLASTLVRRVGKNCPSWPGDQNGVYPASLCEFQHTITR